MKPVVVFDSSVLLLAIHPNVAIPKDPFTQEPLKLARERVEFLIKKLAAQKSKIVIPSPTLSEVLVHAGDGTQNYIDILHRPPFAIAPFGTRAAVDCALAIRRYGSKSFDRTTTRAKLKFDRQIISIAQTNGAKTIYSDDTDIYKYGLQVGISVVRTHELDVAAEDKQIPLDLDKQNRGDGHPTMRAAT